VVEGKEGLLYIMPAPGYLQNGAGHKLRVVEIFILRKAAARKQGVQKQTCWLAVQGYKISCQHICGQRLSTISNWIAGSGALARGKGFTL
jgi:hypothetical protein